LSIETEIKVKIEDPPGFCRRLSTLNAVIVSPRHFEDNQLLDFADRRLRSGRCLLRIRSAEGLGFLTYKGPPRPEGIFKTREEIEIKLEDGARMLQILERLGMHVCFRYQKYRREYALDGVLVAVDETPIGNYVEFEGSEQAIRDLARRMEISESEFLRLSYFSLYLEYCQDRKTAPEFMTF
jgi:adenylate cyclase class 2